MSEKHRPESSEGQCRDQERENLESGGCYVDFLKSGFSDKYIMSIVHFFPLQ